MAKDVNCNPGQPLGTSEYDNKSSGLSLKNQSRMENRFADCMYIRFEDQIS